MKNHVITAIAMLTVLAITSCNYDEVDDNLSQKGLDNSIKIGVLAPITGFLSSAGFWMEGSTKLAQKQINAAGGILGRPIEIVIKNTDFPNTGTALEQAQALIDEGVVALIGPVTSSETIALAPIVKAASILLFNSSAGSDLVTDLDDNDTIFRTEPSASLSATKMGELIANDANTSLSIILIDDVVNQTAIAKLIESYSGGVISQVTIEEGQSSYTAAITELFANGIPEAVYISTLPVEAATISRDIAAYFNAQSISPFPDFYGSGRLRGIGFLDNANPSIAEGLQIILDRTPEAEFTDLHSAFQSDFRTALNLDDAVNPVNVGYDIVWFIAYALLVGDNAGQAISRQTVLDNLRTVINPDNLGADIATIHANDLATVKAAILAEQDLVAIDGRGPLILDVNGDRGEGSFSVFVVQLNDGLLELVETP